MPPLATFERDLASEQLLTDWINLALPSRQSFAQWQQAHFASTSAPDAQPTADPDSDGEQNSIEYLRGSPPAEPSPSILSGVSVSLTGGSFMLQFQQPANRSCVVETSSDFQTWSRWNVPGNAESYPATTITRILVGPMDVPNRYFRLRLGQP
jgi:hypothetical protein